MPIKPHPMLSTYARMREILKWLKWAIPRETVPGEAVALAAQELARYGERLLWYRHVHHEDGPPSRWPNAPRTEEPPKHPLEYAIWRAIRYQTSGQRTENSPGLFAPEVVGALAACLASMVVSRRRREDLDALFLKADARARESADVCYARFRRRRFDHVLNSGDDGPVFGGNIDLRHLTGGELATTDPSTLRSLRVGVGGAMGEAHKGLDAEDNEW